MKVYVKKSDRPSTWVGYAATLIFLVFVVGVTMRFIKGFNGVYTIDSLMINLDYNWTPLLFGMIFAFFLASSIFITLKKPGCHRARLVEKTTEFFKGQEIDYMSFILKKQQYHSIKCYTPSPNEFVVGRDYAVTLKGFSQRIKTVSELGNGDELSDIRTRTMFWPFFMTIEFVFIIQMIYPVVRLIYAVNVGISTSTSVALNLSMALLFGALSFIGGFFIRSRLRKQDMSEADGDDTEPEIEDDSQVEDIPQPDDKLDLVDAVQPAATIPLSCGAAQSNDSPHPTHTFQPDELTQAANAPYDSVVTLSDTIPPPVTPTEISQPSEIKIEDSDENRLIEGLGFKTASSISLSAVKKFGVFRASDDAAEAYLVADDDKNLLYQIKQNGLTGRTYTILDQTGGTIGEIERSFYSSTVEYLIRLVNLSPFYVRLHYETAITYELSGSIYTVKSDDVGVESTIDGKDGNLAATVLASGGNGEDTSQCCAEVTLSPNTENNASLVLIALCLVMGSFDRYLN